MKIQLKKIKVRDLVEDYNNNLEEGVVGYAGKLDIRPAYQREFIYKESQQQAVIDTVTKGFPLNIMYWAVREQVNPEENQKDSNKETEENYEVIDGQQRTLSICKYVNGDFSHNDKYFYNLWDEEQEKILDYELDVYLCKGTEPEKLNWFKTINIAGEKLTDQELRNAVYHGPWVSDAKRYFSKTKCPAYQVGSDYMSGTPIRQDYLETVIKWKSKGRIKEYMGKHQYSESAEELWKYFKEIIDWIQKVFPVYRKEMKGLPWGPLYDKYKKFGSEDDFDSNVIEEEIQSLMADEDVSSKKGIYEYILSRDEKLLNIRSFNKRQRREAYEKQDGICVKCEEKFDIKDMDADHITPWSKGGQTVQENCQMLCKSCNRRKSNK